MTLLSRECFYKLINECNLKVDYAPCGDEITVIRILDESDIMALVRSGRIESYFFIEKKFQSRSDLTYVHVYDSGQLDESGIFTVTNENFCHLIQNKNFLNNNKVKSLFKHIKADDSTLLPFDFVPTLRQFDGLQDKVLLRHMYTNKAIFEEGILNYANVIKKVNLYIKHHFFECAGVAKNNTWLPKDILDKIASFLNLNDIKSYGKPEVVDLPAVTAAAALFNQDKNMTQIALETGQEMLGLAGDGMELVI